MYTCLLKIVISDFTGSAEGLCTGLVGFVGSVVNLVPVFTDVTGSTEG